MAKHPSYGPSYWFDIMWCLKRHDLAQQHPDVDTGGSGTHIGSMFHQFAAKYHADKDQSIDFVPTHDEQTKANTFIRFYTQNVTPDQWGKVVACEERLIHPTREKMEGTPDLVVDIDEAKANELAAKFNEPFFPGRYIIDYKTMMWFNRDSVRKYIEGPQFKWYQVLWNDIHKDEEPIAGVIMILVHGVSAPKLQITLIPSIDNNDRNFIINSHESGLKLLDMYNGGLRLVNARACSDPWPCPWKKNGKCTGEL